MEARRKAAVSFRRREQRFGPAATGQTGVAVGFGRPLKPHARISQSDATNTYLIA